MLRSDIGVGVAFVVFLAVEEGHPCQGAVVEQVPLAADFHVAALFWRRVGRAPGGAAQVHTPLVGVARGVVRGAVRHVVGAGRVGLKNQAHPWAPQAVGAFVAERAIGVAVRGFEVVVAQAAHQFHAARQGQGVLHVQAQVARFEGVECSRGTAIGHPGAVVRRAYGGVGARRGVGVAVVAVGVFIGVVDACNHFVLLATQGEGVAVVALDLRDVAARHAAFGAAREYRAVGDLVEAGGAWLHKTNGAGQQVAFVAACAQSGLQLAAIVKAVGMAQGEVLRGGVEVVAGQTVVVFRWQGGKNLPVLAQHPGVVVERATFHVQVVQAHRKLVACAYTPGKRGRQALFFLARTVVIGVVNHGVQAQGGVFTRDEVEVARQPVVLACAVGVRGLVLVHQQGRFVDLVDHATGGAFAKQHGGRAFEHFDAVEVEGVALLQGGVFHAVGVDVTGLKQREAAQAHIFFTGFACQEGDARGGAQHFTEIVLVAIRHQLFREHGDRLRNVFDVLLALADGGLAREHRVFVLDFGCFLHRDGGQGGFWGRLCPAADRGGQQQCTQRDEGLVLRGKRGVGASVAGSSGCSAAGQQVFSGQNASPKSVGTTKRPHAGGVEPATGSG